MDEECYIYLILSKLGSAYSVFVSTFYAMREAIGKAYQKPTLNMLSYNWDNMSTLKKTTIFFSQKNYFQNI
jgi:hypothetical protein